MTTGETPTAEPMAAIEDKNLLTKMWDSTPNVVRRGAALVSVITVSALGGNAILGGTSGTRSGGSNTEAANKVDDPNCDDINLTDTAFQYDNKFLPVAKGGVSDDKEAANYTKSLFGNDGPLGGEADKASLAVIDAVIVKPAVSSSTNNSYNYSSQFRQTFNKLSNSSTSADKAKELCEAASVILGSTVKYDEGAITKGEDYTTVSAVDGKEQVEGMKLERHTANSNISGATYKVRLDKQTVKIKGEDVELNGFKTVVVEEDGTIDVVGVLPISSGKERSDDKSPSGKRHDKQEQPSGRRTRSTRSEGNGGGSSTGGSNQNGQGEGSGVSQGPVRERNPGPARGNAKGNSGRPTHNGSTPEAAPNGPHNTPGAGGGGGSAAPSAPAGGGGETTPTQPSGPGGGETTPTTPSGSGGGSNTTTTPPPPPPKGSETKGDCTSATPENC